MNYQLETVERLMKSSPGYIYEVDPTGYALEEARPMDDPAVLQEYLERVKTIIEEENMELVLYTQNTFFDEGGPLSRLVFANKYARARVWGEIDKATTDKNLLPESVAYSGDLLVNPEDYKVYNVSPV